jgi:hypothetical protein
MKQLSVGLVLCATMTAALVGQTPKYGATVAAEKNVQFARFKTYSWTKGQPSFDKTVDAQIVAAVDRELNALGMTRATSGPGDVLAAYYSVSRTDVAVKAKPDAAGARPQQAVGTLMVALLDPVSRRRLLRLRVDRPIGAEPDKFEATINAAVAEMFALYPTRDRK